MSLNSKTVETVSPGNRKRLYRLLQSKIIVSKRSGLIRNSATRGEVRLGRVIPSFARQLYSLDHSYPPPHMVDHLICGESHVY
jgi:hypothetical protein